MPLHEQFKTKANLSHLLQKTQWANLIRHVPTGIYFARTRFKRKLICIRFGSGGLEFANCFENIWAFGPRAGDFSNFCGFLSVRFGEVDSKCCRHFFPGGLAYCVASERCRDFLATTCHAVVKCAGGRWWFKIASVFIPR